MSCRVCGAECGTFLLCFKCNKLKEAGKIIKCEKCGKYHYSDKPCPDSNPSAPSTKPNNKPPVTKQIPKTANAFCIVCGKETVLYAEKKPQKATCAMIATNVKSLKKQNSDTEERNKKRWIIISIKETVCTESKIPTISSMVRFAYML